ncbi:MAG: hypothetical protein ABII02_00655 [Candidatus Magasanikbacteria bacterium]
MAKIKESTMQLTIAILLGIIGLIILLVFFVIRSQADDATTSGQIENSLPTVELIQLGDSATTNEILLDGFLDLYEDTTRTVYLNGVYQDLNGCEDVDNVTPPANSLIGLVTREDIAWTGLYATNGTSTYLGFEEYGGCTINCTPGNVTSSFYCPIDIYHFADATDVGEHELDVWAVNVIVQDLTQAQGGGQWTLGTTSTFEMNTLAAVDVDTSINYGSVTISATSTEAGLEIKNTGNDNTTDITMKGTDMGCSVGTIDVGDQWFGLISGTHENQLSDVSSSTVNLNLAKQQYDNDANSSYTTEESTTTIYWALNITEPTGGDAVAGTCTGTTTLYGQSSI